MLFGAQVASLSHFSPMCLVRILKTCLIERILMERNIVPKGRGIYFWFFLFLFWIFFVFRGFWLLWLLAFVAFGFRGFCGFWLLAFWPIHLFVYTYLFIYLSFFLLAAVLLSLFVFAFPVVSLQRRNQTRKQASKQARAAHLWIWCAAGGGAARPPTPPAPRNLHFIPDTRACHEINILR